MITANSDNESEILKWNQELSGDIQKEMEEKDRIIRIFSSSFIAYRLTIKIDTGEGSYAFGKKL